MQARCHEHCDVILGVSTLAAKLHTHRDVTSMAFAAKLQYTHTMSALFGIQHTSNPCIPQAVRGWSHFVLRRLAAKAVFAGISTARTVLRRTPPLHVCRLVASNKSTGGSKKWEGDSVRSPYSGVL